MLDASMNWGKSVRVSDLNTWQVKMVKSWKRTFPSVENVVEISAEVDLWREKMGLVYFFLLGNCKCTSIHEYIKFHNGKKSLNSLYI